MLYQCLRDASMRHRWDRMTVIGISEANHEANAPRRRGPIRERGPQTCTVYPNKPSRLQAELQAVASRTVTAGVHHIFVRCVWIHPRPIRSRRVGSRALCLSLARCPRAAISTLPSFTPPGRVAGDASSARAPRRSSRACTRRARGRANLTVSKHSARC